MQISESQRIPAARAAVWAALNDPQILKHCIPGCQSLEMTAPGEMTATVVVKIGPVKATFGGKVTLSDVDPPNGYRITGEGSGGVAGFAKGGATVRLEEDGLEATILHYEAGAEIGGKLAQLGGRLIDSTVRKLAAEFFAALGKAVGSEAAEKQQPAAPQKASWLSRLTGTAGAAAIMVALSANWCCVGGHAHEQDMLGFGHVCTSPLRG